MASRSIGRSDDASPASVLGYEESSALGLRILSLPPRLGGEPLPWPIGKPDAQYSPLAFGLVQAFGHG